MKQQLSSMLALQDKMNTKVHPQWREQGYQWFRAVWTECAELMDHHGWKWWKKQTPDTHQIHLEIVDIWHFGMSMLLLENENIDGLAQKIEEQWQPANSTTDFLEAVEALASETLSQQSFSIGLFCQLMSLSDFSNDDLYRQYIGKNVLNFFRQDHGYKDGTYHKIWQDKEDNEHLAEILNQLDASSGNFQDQVYSELENRYPK